MLTRAVTMTDDAAARRRALDPATSFAVRAPAGSGKTTLLTQRVLRLLASVEHPEQIVAITFTRKAAEEMRTRLIEALALAAGPAPADDFRRLTWELAVAAREQDRRQGWQLDQQPARLRIMTIDALCQHLVRQMPITAGLAGLPAIEEEPGLLYEQAARDALTTIADGGDYRATAAHVLAHSDNDWSKLESLLADMLGKRDQWLRVLAGGARREPLEQAFVRVVDAELATLAATLPAAHAGELAALGAWAGANLDGSPLHELNGLPPPQHAHLAAWQALADLLLTRAGEWRKRIDKRAGFPAGGGMAGEMKQRWADLVAELPAVPQLRARLARVRLLPARAFADGEWDTVRALIRLMINATAQLMVACDQRGRSDFTAFAMAALDALGEPEAPTDLALSLDYQLRHLLIDEFQDTSITQFDLVQRLTAGWSQGDGRTLFLVGDPMQSIYRFRQADVSLFRRVLAQGHIGSVAIEALTLSVNFRAQAALVSWINDTLPRALEVLEVDDDHFVRQVAERAAAGTPCVLHAFAGFDAAAEARRVCEVIADLRGRDAQAGIAVLVRSRTHLGYTASALMAAGISVAAREIKPFTEQTVVADLIALSRALLHPADRVAWLAVLRAPWCGLELATLTRLAGAAPTLFEALTAASGDSSLPAAERARLARVRAVFDAAFEQAGRLAFSALLESTWIALGGPAVIAGEAQARRDARALFDAVAALERDGLLPTAGRIASRLARRFSMPAGGAADAVQIMTVHGAKGLEFDHVIVPGLGRRPRAEDKPLLLWHDEIDAGGARDLLLAPLPVKGESPLYDYLRAREREEAAAESVRLLYVALTRAREQVHLLAHANAVDDGWRAESGSFLRLLWPVLAEDFAAGVAPPVAADGTPPALPALRRVAVDALPAPRLPEAAAENVPPTVEFDWAGTTARHVGTVTHRLLQHYAPGHNAGWTAHAVRAARGQLRALGVAEDELDAAQDLLRRALEVTLGSARGRWLFAPEHSEPRAELCLAASGADGGRVIIDRTFVDAAGQRWIVDFKTGTHAGGGLEAWLDAEVERYRPQLERYARVVARIEDRPIRLGLYFPLLDAWREWAWAPP